MRVLHFDSDLLQLWEQTQAENTKLRLELSGVKNENETLKHQLGSAAQQVSQINAVTDAEKREKQIVLKKLAEMEEELKVGGGLLISNNHQLSIYQSAGNLSTISIGNITIFIEIQCDNEYFFLISVAGTF